MTTAFGFKAPRTAVASPYAIAPPVRGCVGWHDLGYPDTTARFKNLAAPQQSPVVSTPDPQSGYAILEGKTGKRIQTQISETNDMTILMLVKSDATLVNEGAGNASCRAIANYNSGTPAGLSFRLFANRVSVNANGLSSEVHVTYTNLTSWRMLALRIKAGAYIRTDNLTEDRRHVTSQSGVSRALGIAFRLGSSITTDTTSEAIKMNHLSIYSRVLSDEELAVCAALVRSRALVLGITEGSP